MFRLWKENDEDQLEFLQRSAFNYFLTQDPVTGLIPDTSREGAPCSIAAVGFGLSCFAIGAERGWITRSEAVQRVLKPLRFFAASPQGPGAEVTGYKGFYYHFLDMRTGLRVWDCELSLIDTTLLLAGMLTAATYFDAGTAEEKEIRDLADMLYRRMDWIWAQDGHETISQGWLPDAGFLHYGWEGYSEAIILYVLALGAPTTPLPGKSYHGWRDTYQWENIYDDNFLYAGPLFIHLFSHAWIDFRGIKDPFFQKKDSDYFENTKKAIRLQREYAKRNPLGFNGYGSNIWGFTACDGPAVPPQVIEDRHQHFLGYAARGVPFGPDDGTIAPWAGLACLPFEPALARACLDETLKRYPALLKEGKFPGSYNPSVAGDGPQGWVSEGFTGLDQGLVVMMIENHRSRMIWDLMKKCAPIRTGLARAGFRKGWLS